MRTFSCFIKDDRYTVPSLALILVQDEHRARELARRQLLESGHHLEIEVMEEGRSVFRLSRLDERP